MARALTNHVFCLLSFCFPLLKGNRNTAQISYFSDYCKKLLTRNSPREEQFGRAYSLRECSLSWCGICEPVSHVTSAATKQGYKQEMGLGYKISRHTPSDPRLSVRPYLVRVPQQPSKMAHHLDTRYSNTRAYRRCFRFKPKQFSWMAL